MSVQQYAQELIVTLKSNAFTKQQLNKLKNKLCTKYNIAKIPTDIELLLHANPEDFPKLTHSLQSKPMRSLSGVAPVAVMTRPIACAHGRCTFCPGGPGSYFGNVPQSYTGHEPSTMRGMRNNYDSYLEVINRLEQYTVLAHTFDKIELIIMGGTFPSFPKQYQEDFVMYALKAMNDFSELFFVDGVLDIAKFRDYFELPGDIHNLERATRIQNKFIALKNNVPTTLDYEQHRNETTRARCVAMVVETKPDYAKIPQINEMLHQGVTRVEIGVQHLDNSVLLQTNRGHTVEDTIESVQQLKDSLFKITYHIMLGLPGSTPERDIAVIKELFSNPQYMPDSLKIYPCMVSPGTQLYDEWKRGAFTPITTADAARIIAHCKQYIPPYCRIMRVQRDIPPKWMAAGVDRSNLRQYVDDELKHQGITCNCIRCREPKDKIIDLSHVKIIRTTYNSSGGTEVFLSAEDTKNNLLLGFCRLRIPFKPFRPEITEHSAGIRELHVYGQTIPLGSEGKVQHRGLGKQLLAEAERIAQKEFGKKKLVVISGIGVREYYKKLGYKLDGPYMSKEL